MVLKFGLNLSMVLKMSIEKKLPDHYSYTCHSDIKLPLTQLKKMSNLIDTSTESNFLWEADKEAEMSLIKNKHQGEILKLVESTSDYDLVFKCNS